MHMYVVIYQFISKTEVIQYIPKYCVETNRSHSSFIAVLVRNEEVHAVRKVNACKQINNYSPSSFSFNLMTSSKNVKREL